MERRNKKKFIILHLKGRVQKVNVMEITYIEALQHDLIYHMEKDRVTYTVKNKRKADMDENLCQLFVLGQSPVFHCEVFR